MDPWSDALFCEHWDYEYGAAHDYVAALAAEHDDSEALEAEAEALEGANAPFAGLDIDDDIPF